MNTTEAHYDHTARRPSETSPDNAALEATALSGCGDHPPTSFTLNLLTDPPGALLHALQDFADHASADPVRSDAALVALEVVRQRMTHPRTIHQILQPALDPIGINPVNLDITPVATDAGDIALRIGLDSHRLQQRAATCLRAHGYTVATHQSTDLIISLG